MSNTREYYIENKKRNLDIKSSGVVSSTKYFPVFEELSKERIFKPLSKTKPYSTPLFAYSEAFWSKLIHDYIDLNTPIYQVAICHGLSKEQEKYYDKGTIVDNVLKEDEKLINLLELFRKYKDSNINIDNYVNYCEMNYDYSKILKSDFFTTNKILGEKLAKQILCSILIRDDNFHYENVNFIEKNGKIIDIAPMMDMEFSEMFMFPDNMKRHKEKFSIYDEGMCPIFKYNDDISFDENYNNFINKLKNNSIYDKYDFTKSYYIRKNIYTITELYPEMCKEFLKELRKLKNAVFNTKIEFDTSYLEIFSSNDWKPYQMIYKDGKSKDDKEYIEALKENALEKKRLDPYEFNKRLKKEVIWSIDKLTSMINLCMDIKDGKITVIADYENKTLYSPVERVDEELLKEVEKTKSKINKKY